MRLTLWPHFSSNHSAGFTIVGKFQDAQAAKQAEAELLNIFHQLEVWASDHPDQAEALRQNIYELSPPEMEFQQRYGIQWELTLLEWLVTAHEQGRTRDAVTVVDNLLLLSCPTDTWSSGFPLFALVEKLGASVKADSEILERRLTITMRFDAPDESTADEIERALTKDYYLKVVPWLAYYGGRLAAEPEKLVSDVQAGNEWMKRYFKNWEAERDNPERQRLLSQISAANTLAENEQILKTLRDLEKQLGLVSVLETEYAADWQRNIELNVYLHPLDIQKNGLSFHIANLPQSPNTFDALVAWLRVRGFQVQYDIEETA